MYTCIQVTQFENASVSDEFKKAMQRFKYSERITFDLMVFLSMNEERVLLQLRIDKL